jgi:hypothetical protein
MATLDHSQGPSSNWALVSKRFKTQMEIEVTFGIDRETPQPANPTRTGGLS